MGRKTALAFVALATGLFVTQAATAAELDKGNILEVQIERDSHMKVGETVRARTVYPIYENNQLLLPAGTELVGTITKLDRAPKKLRQSAKLGGDFTPLHAPRIQFERVVLADGTEEAINALPAAGGVEVVRFQALSSSAHHPSLVKKLWADAVGREKETVRTFTAPGKKDRLRRALYAELPYHPELLTEGTQFSVELADAVDIPSTSSSYSAKETEDGTAGEKGVDKTVTLAAELVDDISSNEAVRGANIRAVVTEPLFEDGELRVPQGTLLLGQITQAHPAGKWGKGGVLRFSFRQLQFPAGFVQQVHGAPVAVDAARSSNVELDAEGGVKPASRGMAAPLLMALLAASAAHEDEASVMHTAGASNGFALIGRVASLASKSPYVGAAFGFYGTGRAVYSRWIAHGQDVSFPKHTRIEVALDPERVNALKPAVK